MEGFNSMEPRYSESTTHISEPPDITNWFSSYVYESIPLCSSVNESENEVDVNKVILGVTNKDHKPMYKKMEQISDQYLHESLPSEPPDIGNWFSSYVYESPMLDISDGLELSVPGESECVKKTEGEKETTEVERNEVFPRLFEQELVCSAKLTDFSESQSALSEPPDIRNWFSSYEYQTPQLSDTHELGFSCFEKDKLIIEESDTEEEISCGIFRKTKSKQETITLDRLNSNVYKENIASDKEISSEHACLDQEMEKQLSVGSFHASKTEVKQESSFTQEQLFSEPKEAPRFSLIVSRYPEHNSASRREASLHELSPKHIEETIIMNSNRRKSPTDQESDDKENIHGQSTETGFVTMKKGRDRCSTTKPNTGGLVECSRSKELKNVAKEEDKDERKKKRKVLGEMSNHQFSEFKEITGNWCCPQKSKGNIVPPLKQLRLDAWIHKV